MANTGHKNTLIVIVGPTAVGKTAASIHLAKHLECEIISADSRQFYQEMQIGTAKPTLEEMDGVPHHFVDFLPVDQKYSAGAFERDVIPKLDELFKTNQAVIMVGGSGLYIDAICKGMDDVKQSDEKIRNQLIATFEKEGIVPLQEQLKELDPVHFEQMDQQNPHRLMRAIEVCLVSGLPYSAQRKKEPKQRPFNILKVGLTMDRELLYQRINLRVDLMVEAGLLTEAKTLFPKKHLQALQTVGYRELFLAFEEKCTVEEAISEIKKNSRRYAKRQLTWFKKDEETTWFEPTEKEKISELVSEKLNK